MGKIVDLEKFYGTIGENIKKHRSRLGYSQEDIANFLDLTRSSVVNIEKGRQRPPLHTLLELASFFKIDITQLTRSANPKEQVFSQKEKESLEAAGRKFKDIPIDQEKLSHFFQISNNQ